MEGSRLLIYGLLILGLWLSFCVGQNAPVCTNSFITIEEFEDVAIGTLLRNFSAAPDCADPDSGNLTYTIISGNTGSYFAINDMETLEVGMTALDAEAVDGSGNYLSPYKLIIEAEDEEFLSSYISVVVVVLSANDFTPGISLSTSSVSVDESVSLGTSIASCVLSDGDYAGGLDATVEVSFLAGNEQNLFAINKDTCDITVIGALDYETNTTFTLTVEATDTNVTGALTSTQDLTVNVQDENDVGPDCPFNEIIIALDEGIFGSIFNVTCEDTDFLPLVYSKDSGDSRLDVSLTGEITLSSPGADYEAGDRNLIVEVLVTDQGNLATILSTTVTVTIAIIDEDDNFPVFDSSTYDITISEGTELGTQVLNMTATDDDGTEGDEAVITYGFAVACSQDWFDIHTSAGYLVVKDTLDYATASSVTCTAQAYSSDMSMDTDSAVITINITPENLNDPVFGMVLYEATVSESDGAGTSVITVAATDADSGNAGVVRYSIETSSPFTIGAVSGQVDVDSTLDYETDQRYLLLVRATDQGTPARSADVYLSITVDPENEFDPVITSVPDQTVPEDSTPGTLITTVAVSDSDSGVDGDVLLTLADPTLPFVIEPDTGALRVGLVLDTETTPTYDVVVVATDQSGTTPRSSSTTVTVTVSDANDSAPNCDALGPITITPSTVNIDDVIGQLTCTDDDSGATLTYTETSGDTNNIFQVDINNGDIRLVTAYVYGTYTYTVTVSDGGSPAMTTVAAVEIRVEESLSFVGLPDTTAVSENAPLADLVYTVNAEGAFDLVTYSIQSGASGKFSIHPSLGQVRLLGELDRETTDSYTLTIRAASTNGQTLDSTLTVTVNDVNDNTPQFANTFNNASFVESVGIPLSLAALPATDPDLGNNADIDYAIQSGDTQSAFTIDTNGNLILSSPVDYESDQYFDLVITATDRGSPALTGTTQVYVTVANVDDDPLTITPSSGTVSIALAEDVAVGYTAVQIDATDDFGIDIDYTIGFGNDFEYFSINPNTGALYVALPLDRETESAYVLGVVVNSTDGDTATVTVSITVTDVNDNDPQFHIGNYVFEVAHAAAAGTDIGTLTVTDADATSPSNLYDISIESGDASGDLTFDGDILEAATALDANTVNLYNLVVIAVDRGTTPRTSTAYVTVHVADEFQQPLFSPDTATISVEETRTTGSIIFDSDATASGAAEEPTGDLQYSVSSGNSEGKFYVEEYTGAVQLLQPLSFAGTTQYNLVILAVNKYVPSTLSDLFTLTIDVTQVNKYDPVFTEGTYSWTISEDATVGITAGTISATDADLGAYGTVSYALEPSSATFSVDANTGTVTLDSALEYSVAKSYHYYITATDNAGNSSRTATAALVITVIDVNNNAPTFADSPYTVPVSETTATSTAFYVVRAQDLDDGAFGTVTYAITSGNDAGIFAVDSSTGALSLALALDYETTIQHVLTIEGSDGGTPSLTGTATVTVDVLDMNDNTPDFGTTRQDIVLSTSLTAMATVRTLAATDADTGGSDGVVNYVISSGNDAGLFAIDTVTGEITTTTDLASEEGFYEIVILAIDQGLAALTGTTTMGISVQLVTTTPSGDFSYFVNENEDAGEAVGTIPNTGGYSNPTYAIVGGNFETSFSISTVADEGVIVSTKGLDREEYAYYQLNVDITHDFGVNTVTVVIQVTDDNDNRPDVDPNPLTLTMVENLPVGTSIGTILATDADEAGVNTDLTYTISDNTPLGPVFFSVDSTTGDISVASTINYEVFPYIEFEVRVTDNGGTIRTTTATIEVTVVDVDEVVTFTEFETTSLIGVEFPYDLGQNEIAYTLTPADFGVTTSTGDVVSYLTDDYGVFNVDSSTGEMSLFLPEQVEEVTSIVQWVVLSVTSGATTTAHSGLIRLDTFNKDKHLIAVVSSYEDTQLAAAEATLETHLQTFYTSPQQIKIWQTEAIVPALTRRRLLQTSSGSVALAVVLVDSGVDTITNFDQFKTFLEQEAALAPLITSSDGTPAFNVSGQPVPVSSVLSFVSGERPLDLQEDDGLDEAVIALIVVAAIAAVVVLAGLLVLAWLCCECCARRRSIWKEDRKQLIDEIKTEQSQKAFVSIEEAPDSAPVVVIDDSLVDKEREESTLGTDQDETDDVEEADTTKRDSAVTVAKLEEINEETNEEGPSGRELASSPDYKSKFGGDSSNNGYASIAPPTSAVFSSSPQKALSSVSIDLSSRASSSAELQNYPPETGNGNGGEKAPCVSRKQSRAESAVEQIQDPLFQSDRESGSSGSRTRTISVSPAPDSQQAPNLNPPTENPSPLQRKAVNPRNAPLGTSVE